MGTGGMGAGGMPAGSRFGGGGFNAPEPTGFAGASNQVAGAGQMQQPQQMSPQQTAQYESHILQKGNEILAALNAEDVVQDVTTFQYDVFYIQIF
jgi:hypothetical protein